jgi:glycosyltransferase involved in cell wall biosynthesis
LKIAFFNAFDDNGGAAIATIRILTALKSIGIFPTMWVQKKTSNIQDIFAVKAFFLKQYDFILKIIESLPTYVYFSRERSIFTNALVENGIQKIFKNVNYDIAHFFWMSGGFFRVESIKNINKPIVWTLHDMWPFTGGCHYNNGCERFKSSCGKCPILDSGMELDLSRLNLARKVKYFQGSNITVVATSRWIAQQARESTVFRDVEICNIPNPIDIDVFKPINRTYARELFSLSTDKLLILFSAHGAIVDYRKGFKYFVEAIEIIAERESLDSYELVVIGSAKPDNFCLKNGEIKIHFIDFIKSENQRIALYSACDILIAPSLQENLSNTVMESLSCGTPVVAFDIGGMPDLIEHCKTGYLARAFESTDLADGILFCLKDPEWRMDASINARKFVADNFSEIVVAKKYQNLYKRLLVK